MNIWLRAIWKRYDTAVLSTGCAAVGAPVGALLGGIEGAALGACLGFLALPAATVMYCVVGGFFEEMAGEFSRLADEVDALRHEKLREDEARHEKGQLSLEEAE